MRIVLATVQVPFVRGGAEALVRGLKVRLAREGHQVEVVSMPFMFGPAKRVRHSAALWAGQNFESFDGLQVDRVICVKFPCYLARHPDKVLWLAHQHRSIYDLWGSGREKTAYESLEDWELRWKLRQLDHWAIGECKRRFTISKTVSARLLHHSGLFAEPLYHPPPRADRFYSRPPENFVLAPSRLQDHKRHRLLLEALAQVEAPVGALVVGDGPLRTELEELAERLEVDQRVRFTGRLSNAELQEAYARCLAVFFAPRHEDYGYISLEAMLSAKPVLTCLDSGGPTELVVDGETGAVVEADPEALAAVLDDWAARPATAENLGKAGRQRYFELNISWERVVRDLIG